MDHDRDHSSPGSPGSRISRRTALARVAGAGTVALTFAGLGAPRAGASSRSYTSQLGVHMTDATPSPTGGAPTVVLVHGAWADGSSWAGVIPLLKADGLQVFAVANPLRGPSTDGPYVASVVNSVPGPVLLVAHSYGGAVITEAGTKTPNAVGLVYVAAFAPDEGDTGMSILGRFPPTPLGPALRPTTVPVGNTGQTADEFTIDRQAFRSVFCADLPQEEADLLAATQRPLAAASFGEPFGPPAWKTLPSWAAIATADLVIGTEAVRSMAQRAGATTVDIDASHVVMISQPAAIADLIRTALRAVG